MEAWIRRIVLVGQQGATLARKQYRARAQVMPIFVRGGLGLGLCLGLGLGLGLGGHNHLASGEDEVPQEL